MIGFTTYYGKIDGQVFRCDVDIDTKQVIDCFPVDRGPNRKIEIFDTEEIFMSECESREQEW